ncbi:MAG: TldD/PmbA family protein [Chloroflexi bacterium]|nr:TldD/PmbA family protein [Chloroflexota bacterium]
MLVDPAILSRVLKAALATGGDFAEVFAEDRVSFVLAIEDQRLERMQRGRDRGAGVRVVSGNVTGFAYTELLDEDSLLAAAGAARDVARTGRPLPPVDLTPRRRRPVGRAERPASKRTERELAEIARRADVVAWQAGPSVRQVSVRFGYVNQTVQVANSEGLLTSDARGELTLNVEVTAARDGELRVGRRARGGQAGLELLDAPDPETLAGEAAQVAIQMLDARSAPTGPMPVVINHGWGGVLFHEAVGHGLEADHIVTNGSVYAGKLGTAVAAPIVTLVDDATVRNHRGSFRFDDEGEPGQRTVLVERGVLQGYLTDRKSADTLRLPRSGNGRRQSFRDLPVPRMTNLYIASGSGSPEDLIADTAHGLYVGSLGGGMVEPASGQFVFSVTEGYLIENGRLGAPVRGATISGDAFRVLADIDAVAGDFEMDPGLGNCGKLGQWVPVGVGQPTLRVREILVGGTA